MINKRTLLFITINSLIIISYFFIDRSVVWFLFNNHSRSLYFLYILAAIPNLIVGFIFLFYLYYASRMVVQKTSWQPSKIEQKLLQMSCAVVTTVFLKEGFKFIFGRYWPNTFDCNNLSLINNHVYGFQWLTSQNSSFPSGHTAVVVSFATSMWILFPRWRVAGVLLSMLLGIAQIGLYYHFVSDVLAGAELGFVVAFLMLWKTTHKPLQFNP